MTANSRENEIKVNLDRVRERIAEAAHGCGRDPDEITLIVVTKNFPVSDAQTLYDFGVRAMGENRDEEGSQKSELLPGDIEWHFQGQVQSRKIKSIASWADVVHSLDSISHGLKFDALPEGKSSRFLIQVNFEPERTDRGGVLLPDVESFIAQLESQTAIRPVGLMTVAPIEADPSHIFDQLQRARERVAKVHPGMVFLSMGMSSDFEAAIKAGATHIRVGSSILGSRGILA